MGHKVARLMMIPNEARQRLGAIGFYKNDGKNNFGLLEATLVACLEAEAVDKKIHDAIKSGMITSDDLHDPIEEAARLGLSIVLKSCCPQST